MRWVKKFGLTRNNTKIDLSTQKGYDIACAMRGPDVDLPALKWVFTARIRHLCGVKSNVWVRDKPLSSWTLVGTKEITRSMIVEEILSTDCRHLLHWACHVRDALTSLKQGGTGLLHLAVIVAQVGHGNSVSRETIEEAIDRIIEEENATS